MGEYKKIDAPYIHSQVSVHKMMWQVVLALIPGIIVSAWVLGAGVLVHCLLAVLFALTCEMAIVKLRGRAIKDVALDASSIITGLLFGLSVTPFAPWWVTLYGVFFAIVICKHLYGGLGCNIFNPAMAGYTFVLICFPAELNYWPTMTNSTFMQSLMAPFSHLDYNLMDAISSATPLSHTKSQISNMVMLSEIDLWSLFDLSQIKNWRWISIAFLVGGCWLILQKVIKWQIPLVMLLTVLLLSMIFQAYDSERYVSGVFNVFAGGTVLAAFFIATDPVTSSTTVYGKIMYAVGLGGIIYVIRTWGNYSDGIAFSILIMNALVPFIDYITRPAVFGQTK